MDLYHIWCNLQSDVSSRTGVVEELHYAVNRVARDVKFALYRDFPDPLRERGGEKF